MYEHAATLPWWGRYVERECCPDWKTFWAEPKRGDSLWRDTTTKELVWKTDQKRMPLWHLLPDMDAMVGVHVRGLDRGWIPRLCFASLPDVEIGTFVEDAPGKWKWLASAPLTRFGMFSCPSFELRQVPTLENLCREALWPNRASQTSCVVSIFGVGSVCHLDPSGAPVTDLKPFRILNGVAAVYPNKLLCDSTRRGAEPKFDWQEFRFPNEARR